MPIVPVPGRHRQLRQEPTISVVCRAAHGFLRSTGLDAACFDKIPAMILAIVTSFRYLLGWTMSAFRSRQDLILEDLALRKGTPMAVRRRVSEGHSREVDTSDQCPVPLENVERSEHAGFILRFRNHPRCLFLVALFAALWSIVRSRADLELENLALTPREVTKKV